MTRFHQARRRLIDLGFDIYHGVSTFKSVPAEQCNHKGPHAHLCNGYTATGVKAFRSLMRSLPMTAFRGAFLDAGCGKGVTLLIAAREEPFHRVDGIELSSILAATARRNAARMVLADKINVHHGDAVDYRWQGDETLIYVNNSFTDKVLRSVLDGAVASVAESPRVAWLVSLNPDSRDVMEKCPHLIWQSDVVYGDSTFAIYKYKLAEQTASELPS